jgi:hypothetical protein
MPRGGLLRRYELGPDPVPWYVFDRRRCGPYETRLHRMLVFDNGLARLAWTHVLRARGRFGMKRSATAALALLLFALLLTAAACGGSPAPAADPPAVDETKRIHELYAFVSPADAANTVLILTLNAFAGAETPDTFSTAQTYSLLVDDDGDLMADHAFHVVFGPVANMTQTVTIRDEGGSVLAQGATGQDLAMAGGGTARAALHDDPAFADRNALDDLFDDGSATFPRNPAHNFYEDANCLALVIELPSSLITGVGTDVAVWARTTTGPVQVERIGRPWTALWLLPKLPLNDAVNPDLRDQFCVSDDPTMDAALFGAGMEQVLVDFWGQSAGSASALAGVFLPDVLAFDTANAAGYLNGHRLGDDVVDAMLGLLSGGTYTTDNVPNDSTFQGVFPYLAAPHPVGAGPNPD